MSSYAEILKSNLKKPSSKNVIGQPSLDGSSSNARSTRNYKKSKTIKSESSLHNKSVNEAIDKFHRDSSVNKPKTNKLLRANTFKKNFTGEVLLNQESKELRDDSSISNVPRLKFESSNNNSKNSSFSKSSNVLEDVEKAYSKSNEVELKSFNAVISPAQARNPRNYKRSVTTKGIANANELKDFLTPKKETERITESQGEGQVIKRPPRTKSMKQLQSTYIQLPLIPIKTTPINQQKSIEKKKNGKQDLEEEAITNLQNFYSAVKGLRSKIYSNENDHVIPLFPREQVLCL